MDDKVKFIEGLEQEDLALLRMAPKTDLHNHAFFGTRRYNIETWAKCKIAEPAQHFQTLQEMGEYASSSFVPYISSGDGVEFVFDSAIQDAIDDGVTILEMSIDTRVIMLYNSFASDMLSLLRRLKSKYKERILFLPELGISRDHKLEEIESTITECIESEFFCSIDLYGCEDAQPCDKYRHIYKNAKSAGMKLKAHIGEFGTAESIRTTVEMLELDNVQHGISAVDSKEIMNWLAINKIQLNICPTSNVMLSRVSEMKYHPIRILFDNGIHVTINTDDLSVFDQSVSEEYLNLFKAGVLSAEELEEIRRDAVNHATQAMELKAKSNKDFNHESNE